MYFMVRSVRRREEDTNNRAFYLFKILKTGRAELSEETHKLIPDHY